MYYYKNFFLFKDLSRNNPLKAGNGIVTSRGYVWRENFDLCNFIANYENYKMLIEMKCITCKTSNAIMLPKLSPANRLWNSLLSQTPYLGLKILHLWTAVLFHDEASASSNLCNIASSDLFYSLPNACNGLPLMWFLPSAKFLFFFKTPNIHWLRSWDVAGNQSLIWH